MRIVVTGATGNVGTSVLAALAGDPRVEEIVGLARRFPLEQPAHPLGAADVAPAAGRAFPRRRRRHPPRVADPALARRRPAARRQRRRLPAGLRGGRRGRRRRARPRLLGRRLLAGADDRAVDESWPTDGIPTSFYARHKAAAERLLDEVEAAHPGLRVVRLRPGLIFKREAAGDPAAVRGPVPAVAAARPGRLPLLPLPAGLCQAVHSADVGEAYRLAATDQRARGAYNVAADPVLDAAALGRMLGARPVASRPRGARRRSPDLAARLQPTPPGWLDMGMPVPLMAARRIREELGWAPRHAAATRCSSCSTACARAPACDAAARPACRRAAAAPRDLDGHRRPESHERGVRRGETRARHTRPADAWRREAPPGPGRVPGRVRKRGRRGSSAPGARAVDALAREPAGRAQEVAHARLAAGGALERGGVRRVAAQQPGAVGAAHELLALGELAERRRHRRPAGADELPEDPVREREGDDDAVAADTAPALGEMPEQRLEAPIDARELRDRLRRREPQRALRHAVEQRGGDLGPRRELGGEAPIEHRERRGESTVHSASTGSSPVFDAGCQGRSRSPGPSSSALTWSATISSRAITPSITSRPMWSALALESRETSHAPTPRRWV